MSRLPLIAAAAFALALAARGEAGRLKIGDPAPKLKVSKWVQGEPVEEFKAGTAYIVEFWATWCGPCRVSIPHLNEIHLKFKDKGLVVIGQNVSEPDQSQVAPFVKKMGDKMTYRVALDFIPKGDDAIGVMSETWMEAAGQKGIPSAFLVDKKGMLAWVGHPMTLQESVITQVLDGTYDVKKAAAEFAKEHEMEDKTEALNKELGAAVKKEDWAAAEAVIDKAEKELPGQEPAEMNLRRFRFRMMGKNYKSAYKLAADMTQSEKTEHQVMDQLAWMIATLEGVEERDLDLAEKLARKANEKTNGAEPGALLVLARVLFTRGQIDQAIEFQEKAVSVVDPSQKDKLKAILETYRAAKKPAAK